MFHFLLIPWAVEQGGTVGQPVLGYIPVSLPVDIPVYLPGFLGSQSAEVSCLRTTSNALNFNDVLQNNFINKTTLTEVLAPKCEMRQILQIFQTKPERTSLKPWKSQKERCKCFMLTHKVVCQDCQEIFHRNSSIAFFSKGEKTSFTSFKNYLQSTSYLVLVPKNFFYFQEQTNQKSPVFSWVCCVLWCSQFHYCRLLLSTSWQSIDKKSLCCCSV